MFVLPCVADGCSSPALDGYEMCRPHLLDSEWLAGGPFEVWSDDPAVNPFRRWPEASDEGVG